MTIDYLNVLDAERQQFDLQQQYVSAQQIEEARSLVGLYKALGGVGNPTRPFLRFGQSSPPRLAAVRPSRSGVH